MGGTGKMGGGLAKRLARTNEVVIGSRDRAKAQAAASKIEGVRGEDYRGASKWAEVVVVSVPFEAIGALAELRNDVEGKLVISLVNPVKMEGGVLKFGKESGSAAQDLARILPKSRVATAFNSVPQGVMSGDAEVPPMDILVAADTKETFEEAARLVRSIPNMRALHAGPLSEAEVVERITPLLVNLAHLNGTKALWTKFVSKSG